MERIDHPPPQHQSRQPGSEREMTPEPDCMPRHPGAGKLDGKVVLITGGDSGIGRAVAILSAREGADIAFIYLDEDRDAEATRSLIEAEGRDALTLRGDVGDEGFCRDAVARVIDRFGRLDVVVNNAGEQHPQTDLEDISSDQLERTFRTNVFGYFYLTKAALPHLTEGASIINTTSVTAYKGNPALVDYSATKGAIVAFTRSLSQMLAGRGIRVNGVAPGPIWTPLIPSTFPQDKVESFGTDTPLGRVGQPNEVATAHLFLATDDASYMTGQILHPNGGKIVAS